MKPLTTNQQRIWLIGASSGIGLGLAKHYAALGQKVFVTARNSEPLNKLAAEFSDVHVFAADVTNSSEVCDLIAQIKQQTEYLDKIIYCAGLCEYIDINELELASFHRVYSVNVFAAIDCIHQAMPLLKLSPNKGHIVGVSSLSAKVPFGRAQAYGSSKAAFGYYLDALRIDLQNDLDVTVVNPGFVDTPMTQQNDFAMPTLITIDQAVTAIVKSLDKRPMSLDFPKSLSIPLSIAAIFKPIWCKYIAPKLARGSV